VQILIYQRSKDQQTVPPRTLEEVPFPLELGRQANDTEPMYQTAWRESEGRWRVVVAGGSEQTVGKKHALLELLPGGGAVRVTNTSTMSTIKLGDGASIPQGASRDCPLSVDGLVLLLGDSVVLRLQEGEAPPLEELRQAPTAPGDLPAVSGVIASPPFPSVPGIDQPSLISWLQRALEVLRSPDFFRRATQAVVALAGMDSGRVLLREKGDWKKEPEAETFKGPPGGPAPAWQPSFRVLNKVLRDKKTVYELPGQDGSVKNVRAVVAAPILNAKGEVVGVLYGDRRQEGGRAITEVEALLVQILASGIAAGLARAEHERTALLFEQFFTPQLARHLAEHPEMLQGRSAQVTILFCDVRGFSRVSERLGAEKTVSWIGDIMAELSECVSKHQGTLVDYIGDELMAMWGAPEPQPDHATLACRAALAMLDRLPALDTRWKPVLGESMAFGIGLHSGEAQVGNTGSPRKFKYGPLGDTVNLASRVQGATNHLKTRLLLTEATHQLLGEELRSRARRLCTVRVVNIRRPVLLYEFAVSEQPAWPDWKKLYEQALAKFEEQDFRGAARLLPALTAHPVNDGPSIVLLFRAVQGMKDEAAPDHPVWELPSK
jgi:adenylate cyclase